MPTVLRIEQPFAMSVKTDESYLIVELSDARIISVPLIWFPRLFHATPEQRADYELIGRGVGIHWRQIDEDLSVAGLLLGTPARR